jgi:hypothetical protein
MHDAPDGGAGCLRGGRRAVPTVVFSNITANRTMQEMLALANEMAQRIAYDTRDWTRAEEGPGVSGRRRQDRFRCRPTTSACC